MLSRMDDTRPPRRSQAERRAETQRRLYETALECLVERGYAAMTLSEVVKRSGLTSGALWRYCRTKAELAYAAVRFASDEDFAASASELAAVSAQDVDSLTSLLLREPSDLVSRGSLELLRASASDEQLRRLMAEGSWSQWMELERAARAHRYVHAIDVDGDHGLLLNQPDAVARLVEGFLRTMH